jgi:glycerol-1-phosphate dehydrogenase [NAD(P)+]
MEFPRNTWIGHGAIEEVAGVCRDLQFGKNGVIVTGEDTYKAAGKTIKEQVSKRHDILTVMTGNATNDNVEKVEEAAREHKATFLLAVGGGSKIDISKVAAKNLGIPLVSIPTSVAHDGIASNRASIKSGNGSASVEAVSPISIIADTEIINAAPYKYLAAGCADVISNLTALEDWELAHRIAGDEMSSSAYLLAKYAADDIVANSKAIKPGLEESVWLVLKPIIASGVSMLVAGSSRPTSGSEHMFSHALDVIKPDTALHGAQCGVGTIMMMKLHGGDWITVRNALRNIGAPTTGKELGFTDEEIIEALVRAKKMRDDRFTILGHKGLSPREAEELATFTGVI